MNIQGNINQLISSVGVISSLSKSAKADEAASNASKLQSQIAVRTGEHDMISGMREAQRAQDPANYKNASSEKAQFAMQQAKRDVEYYNSQINDFKKLREQLGMAPRVFEQAASAQQIADRNAMRNGQGTPPNSPINRLGNALYPNNGGNE